MKIKYNVIMLIRPLPRKKFALAFFWFFWSHGSKALAWKKTEKTGSTIRYLNKCLLPNDLQVSSNLTSARRFVP